MTLKTGHLGVSSFESEARNLVLERLDTPRGLGVTLFAFAAAESRLEMIFVVIRMAAKTAFLT